MKTKGKAWQLVVTVLLIAAFVYTAFFGVAVKYGDVTKTYIKGAQDIRFGVDFVATLHAGTPEEAVGRPQVQALQARGAVKVLVWLQGRTVPGQIREVRFL